MEMEKKSSRCSFQLIHSKKKVGKMSVTASNTNPIKNIFPCKHKKFQKLKKTNIRTSD
jgi:hypothetical protein